MIISYHLAKILSLHFSFKQYHIIYDLHIIFNLYYTMYSCICKLATGPRFLGRMGHFLRQSFIIQLYYYFIGHTYANAQWAVLYMISYDLHIIFIYIIFHVSVNQLPDHDSLVEWAILRGNDFTGNLIRRIQPDIGMTNGCDYETLCVKTILKHKRVGKIPEIQPFKVRSYF